MKIDVSVADGDIILLGGLAESKVSQANTGFLFLSHFESKIRKDSVAMVSLAQSGHYNFATTSLIRIIYIMLNNTE
ncbi:hypothetical protein FE394_04430 [Xenorhabdus sp. Reich]|uniref:Uncharacterized protein n=1 Tax=Xenorhabdus littoralis TaxID=2582835 RepID=A0ABU4SIP5_9GAMM|nr:hypothetical protein [Xenorhabdus sp. Reich]